MPVLETAAALASIVGAGASSISAMKDTGDAMYHTRTVARVCIKICCGDKLLMPTTISAAMLKSLQTNGATHTATQLLKSRRTGVFGLPVGLVEPPMLLTAVAASESRTLGDVTPIEGNATGCFGRVERKRSDRN